MLFIVRGRRIGVLQIPFCYFGSLKNTILVGLENAILLYEGGGLICFCIGDQSCLYRGGQI